VSKALFQLSGGYDSAAAFLLAAPKYEAVATIFFDYGQPYARQEKAAADYLCKEFLGRYAHYKIHINASVYVPHATLEGKPDAYYPLRNFVFAASSASQALASGFDTVVVGSKTTELRPDDPYCFPDCTEDFYRVVGVAASLGSGEHIRFCSPLAEEDVDKPDVIKCLHDAYIDLQSLWSCYASGDEPCGVCYHCTELSKAREEAGV